MPSTGSRGRGRPAKYVSDADRKAAKRQARASYRLRQVEKQRQQQQQNSEVASNTELQIHFDPRSIFQRIGPDSEARHAFTLETPAQVEGPDIPSDVQDVG